mmetsp:Transcript_13576/g.34129  ORF Transcript_13576/g.34129 Transcript_13576/m.34129 type:complete len:240 (-) Transcript_13576:131-850(-)
MPSAATDTASTRFCALPHSASGNCACATDTSATKTAPTACDGLEALEVRGAYAAAASSSSCRGLFASCLPSSTSSAFASDASVERPSVATCVADAGVRAAPCDSVALHDTDDGPTRDDVPPLEGPCPADASVRGACACMFATPATPQTHSSLSTAWQASSRKPSSEPAWQLRTSDSPCAGSPSVPARTCASSSSTASPTTASNEHEQHVPGAACGTNHSRGWLKPGQPPHQHSRAPCSG